MHEAGSGHRLDGCSDVLAMPGEAGRERPERITIRVHGRDLNGLAHFIEDMHIKSLPRQVRSGV